MDKKKVVTEIRYQDTVIDKDYLKKASQILEWSKQEEELAQILKKGPMPLQEVLKGEWEDLSPAFGHTNQDVFLYPVVAGYIEGVIPNNENKILPEGMELLFPSPETIYGGDMIVEEIATVFSDPKQGAFYYALVENKQGGALFLAKQAALRLRMPLLVWNGEGDRLPELLLTAVLYDALICVDVRTNKSSLETLTKRMLRLARGVEHFLILFDNREQAKPLYGHMEVLFRNVPKTQRKDRSRFLDDFVKEKGMVIPKKSYRQLEDGLYNIATIRYITEEFAIQAKYAGNGILSEADAEEILQAYEESDGDRAMFGIRQLASNRSLSDLCLPMEQHEKLVSVCSMLKKRDKVLKEWGFADKYSYGNGISLLFYGAPGTGKTMAAQAVAGELGMPLYRVDLSQLISKYIGETQKNIGKIFEQAGHLKGILLFDEADALFSKRNEINDAQDKYSNAETAYLLQRIEEWDGICILATNLLQNFDEAFRRRITYMLNFPMPDEKVRKELWQKVFPKQAQLDADLDEDLLAQGFELSGAAIRNAALQGAYLAAVEDTKIGMKHVLSGIANEYRKLNKSMKPEQKALLEKYSAS